MHFEYLQPVFTANETLVLKKFGRWMLALDQGELEPTTAAQVRFIAVCRDQLPAESMFEQTWSRYRNFVIAEQAEREGRAKADRHMYETMQDLCRKIEERTEAGHGNECDSLYESLHDIKRIQEEIEGIRDGLFGRQ